MPITTGIPGARLRAECLIEMKSPMEQKIPGIFKFLGKRTTSRDCPKCLKRTFRKLPFHSKKILYNFRKFWLNGSRRLFTQLCKFSGKCHLMCKSAFMYELEVHWPGRLIAKQCKRYKRYEHYKRFERSLLNVTNDANARKRMI